MFRNVTCICVHSFCCVHIYNREEKLITHIHVSPLMYITFQLLGLLFKKTAVIALFCDAQISTKSLQHSCVRCCLSHISTLLLLHSLTRTFTVAILVRHLVCVAV